MPNATDPFLEALAFVHPFGLRPGNVHKNLQCLIDDPPSERSFYRARDELLENGYIEEIGDTGLLRITERGLDYLEGEIKKVDFEGVDL